MSCLILQISHTDISQDSRILKQIRALEALDGFECCGIGIRSAEEAVSGSNSIRSSVKSFDLIVKPNKRIRGIFRYFFAFLACSN